MFKRFLSKTAFILFVVTITVIVDAVKIIVDGYNKLLAVIEVI